MKNSKFFLINTLFEIFIFVQKFNFDFPRKLSVFIGWKTGENVVVLDFLAVDNFDFTRKIVKKIWGKNSWKCWGFVNIEFLDKNSTFRIVWLTYHLVFTYNCGLDFCGWIACLYAINCRYGAPIIVTPFCTHYPDVNLSLVWWQS